MKTRFVRLSVVLVFALLGACGRGGEVKVVEGRVTIPPPGMRMSAGYFTIENGTAKDVEVKALTSDAFDAVEMHETRTENGVSSMHPLTSLSVPSGQSVAFEPGGKHLMLFGPKVALARDAVVTIAFTVVSADGQETKIPVSFRAGEAGETHAH
jgi:copper(I)-binding protein